MASTSPSPNSSPTTLPPASPATSPPPPPQPPPNPSITTPPPSQTHHPNQTSNPSPPSTSSTPNSFAPPPQSLPPASPPASPSPPLPPPATPPPTTSPPVSPLTSPPPATPPASPPSVNSPPSNLPPLAIVPSSPPSNSPTPPLAKPPENSTPTSKSVPPGSTLSPPIPSTSLPPPQRNSSVTPTSPSPSFGTHKPTAKSTPASNFTANTYRDEGGPKARAVVAISIVVGFLVLSLLVVALWIAQKRKKKASTLNGDYILPPPFASSQSSDSSFLRPQESHLAGSASGRILMYSAEHGGLGNSRPWFTYEELDEATNGFSASNLLGEGGFGSVYKGLLPGGREVAIKQLKIGGGQGEREFKAEVEIISRVHHRHLVSLVGYCICENQRLLVYDYVPNNTLHYHLHREGRIVVIDWETRVKVAAGAARGIAYLHEDCHPRIIHRDIKSSNILLDNNFDALVADFGLAKLTLDTYTHVTTRVMGTFGYMAPEYASSGKLTEKSDVFSFGVVLLELITGRKPVDSTQPLGEESLVEWARPLLKRALDDQDIKDLVDPRLENAFVEIEMFHMIEAAAACVRHLASKRPRMSQVVRALDSIFDSSDLTNGMKPGQSEVFDTREHSAQIRMLRRMAFGSQDYSSEFFNHSQNSWRRL